MPDTDKASPVVKHRSWRGWKVQRHQDGRCDATCGVTTSPTFDHIENLIHWIKRENVRLGL